MSENTPLMMRSFNVGASTYGVLLIIASFIAGGLVGQPAGKDDPFDWLIGAAVFAPLFIGGIITMCTGAIIKRI